MPELTFTIDDDHIPLPDPVRYLEQRGTHHLSWSALHEPDQQPPVHVLRTRTAGYLATLSCVYDRDGKIDQDGWLCSVVNDEQRHLRVDIIPTNVANAWEEQAQYWAYLGRVIRRLPARNRPHAVELAQSWTGTTADFEMVTAELFSGE